MRKYGDNYELLIAAIIKLAISDYRKAYRNPVKKTKRKSACTCEEIERFFLSSWGESICMGRNHYIFERLKKDTEETYGKRIEPIAE